MRVWGGGRGRDGVWEYIYVYVFVGRNGTIDETSRGYFMTIHAYFMKKQETKGKLVSLCKISATLGEFLEVCEHQKLAGMDSCFHFLSYYHSWIVCVWDVDVYIYGFLPAHCTDSTLEHSGLGYIVGRFMSFLVDEENRDVCDRHPYLDIGFPQYR